MIRHKKVVNEEGKEDDVKFPVGFIGIPVFRYENTDGKPVEDINQQSFHHCLMSQKSLESRWNMVQLY